MYQINALHRDLKITADLESKFRGNLSRISSHLGSYTAKQIPRGLHGNSELKSLVLVALVMENTSI